MVLVLGSKPNAGTVVEPESPSLRLLLRYFEPFSTPDSLDALVIHKPTFPMEELCDSSIAVATVLARQLDRAFDEFGLESGCPRPATLR